MVRPTQGVLKVPLNKQNLLALHDMNIPDYYVPNPESHLYNVRDKLHYEWALGKLREYGCSSALDIGCFDGWLDFLLIKDGIKMESVELVPGLAAAAVRYAQQHNLDYFCHCNLLSEVKFKGKFDCCLCFETLEHLELPDALEYVKLMEDLATKLILISLPDQRHEDNPQHRWTPTESLIHSLFGSKPGFNLEVRQYPGSSIPSNFLISLSAHEG